MGEWRGDGVGLCECPAKVSYPQSPNFVTDYVLLTCARVVIQDDG